MISSERNLKKISSAFEFKAISSVSLLMVSSRNKACEKACIQL